jgi:cytochrome c oxidase accessory protein FixG
METAPPVTETPRAPRVTLPGTRYHSVRKTVQSICFVIFVLLPMTDAMRFDIPRQRFYFFGAELWISEFSILFLTMMFLWILVAAMAMIYGRFYCGYLCPQMIFSESATWIERRIARAVNRKLSKWNGLTRKWTARAAFYVMLLPGSVFVTFVFVSFFVPPADLFQRLLSFDIRTAGGIVGASVTLLTFLDFAFLRQRFCTVICPYGYLQNMLADRHTLLVHFHDPNRQCINCAKCVRACPMGIDIRRGSHQLECTHCAECVDECSAILGKLGRPSLVQYGWGELDENSAANRKWYRRIGLRDGKRFAILILLVIYATGLSIAIGMRQPVLVRIMPNRITLYDVAPDGTIHNHFRILASNRSGTKTELSLSLAGLASGSITGIDRSVTLAPGETLQREFDIVSPQAGLAAGLSRVQIVVNLTPKQTTATFEETFFAPIEAGSRPGARH